MTGFFEPLREAVQANCHVSDARHAGGMTMCIYLLEMRELFRWERGFAPTATLPRAEVGAWLSERERLWHGLESVDYRPLPVGDARVDPFDVDQVNAALVPHKLVYGAGVGRFGKPQFFLADLAYEDRRDGVRILVGGREHARDLAPAPAATRGGTIWLRTESLRRLLWEKVEPWLVSRREGALASALAGYGFEHDAADALERLTIAERETLILHELGEIEAGRMLGPQWETLLAGLTRRRAEVFVRAVRDHLADCTVTLPVLIARDAMPSIQLWRASLDGMRREIFPRIVAAIPGPADDDPRPALDAAVAAGASHWRQVSERILALHANSPASVDAAIEALADDPGTRL